MSQTTTSARSSSGCTMHGQIGELVGGKPVFGTLTREQIKVWVLQKLGEYKPPGPDGKAKAMDREASVGQAVNDFMDGGKKHKATPYFFENLPVWHCSAGKEDGPDGKKCTLLFTITDPTNGVGKIIGIAHHKTSTSYTILWKRHGWLIGNSVSL
jgi:hypothetical protein